MGSDTQSNVLQADLHPSKISVHEIFDTIQVIPLETTDSCLLRAPVKIVAVITVIIFLIGKIFKYLYSMIEDTSCIQSVKKDKVPESIGKYMI